MKDHITALVNAWYLDFAGCTYDDEKNKQFDAKLQPLEPKPGNKGIANGFYDQDSKEYIHHACKKQHYEIKSKNGMAGLYSEMPVLLN